MNNKVESFELDHTKVNAPYIREAAVYTGPNNVKVTKYDIRFCQPNKEQLPVKAMHSIEHMLATAVREKLEGVIDLSPMGCLTGFYLTVFGHPELKEVKQKILRAVDYAVSIPEVPAANEKQCGNYLLHDRESAKEILVLFSKTMKDKLKHELEGK